MATIGVRSLAEQKTCTLIEAYDSLPDPKPTLGKIIDLIREGELSAQNGQAGQGIVTIEDLEFFVMQVDEWMETNQWRSDRGDLPPGFTPITRYVRRHVGVSAGLAAGLLQPDRKRNRGQLSTLAKTLIKAGDLKNAQQVSARGVWVADPREIELWLMRRFGLRVKD